MSRSPRLLAIIPARSGSKGLVGKNVAMLGGMPLIAHSVVQALDSDLFADVVVSTDSEEYASIARSYGASVPFIRPRSLAEDDVPTSEVILHTLKCVGGTDLSSYHSRVYDAFVVLQPTSPLRMIEDIRGSCTRLTTPCVDESTTPTSTLPGVLPEMVISVCETPHPPQWCGILPENGILRDFIPEGIRNRPRQKLQTYHMINGALFWSWVNVYIAQQDPYKAFSVAYKMPLERSIDIDTDVDLLLARVLYERRKYS